MLTFATGWEASSTAMLLAAGMLLDSISLAGSVWETDSHEKIALERGGIFCKLAYIVLNASLQEVCIRLDRQSEAERFSSGHGCTKTILVGQGISSSLGMVMGGGAWSA